MPTRIRTPLLCGAGIDKKRMLLHVVRYPRRIRVLQLCCMATLYVSGMLTILPCQPAKQVYDAIAAVESGKTSMDTIIAAAIKR